MAKANLLEFGKKVVEHARSGLNNSAKQVEERLKQNVGLTDHSQRDLDRLGNPYAVRHYEPPHTPEELVHTKGHGTGPQDQTGKLRDSIKIRKEGPDTYAIGADETLRDENGETYVLNVIEGTSLMVARNFPKLTLEEVENSKILENIIEKSIEDAIKKF